MNRFERGFVLWAMCYMAVYVLVFFSPLLLEVPAIASATGLTIDTVFPWIMPFHFLGMLQNFVALVLTIRDLYKRPFPRANDKVTWTLLILCTGGVGWIVYLFRHALKPRPLAD